jgi:GNAT superfamily N-acetyltransferase
MHIALLTAADVGVYRALMLEAYATAPDAFTSTPEERAAEPESWWVKRLEDPSGQTAAFGAFNETGLVGTIALEFSAKPKTRHKGHLIGMYVRPEARGAGIGRRLVERALAYAAERPGLMILTLTVTQGNAPAELLYKSMGFEPFGVEPMAIRGSAGYLAKVHMSVQVQGSPSQAGG